MIKSITKPEAKVAARLYLAALIVNYDGFNAENASMEVCAKVDEALNTEVQSILKRTGFYDKVPLNTDEVLVAAKSLIKRKNGSRYHE